jgi:hypothetical protein
MLLAWLHPHIETMWDAIEKMEAAHRNFCRASIAAIASAVMYFWCGLLLCTAWHSNLLLRLQSVVMYLLPYNTTPYGSQLFRQDDLSFCEIFYG